VLSKLTGVAVPSRLRLEVCFEDMPFRSSGKLSAFRDPSHRFHATFHIFLSRRPAGYADAHRGVPLPLRSSAPTCPIALNLRDDPPRLFRAAERDQHLVQHHIVHPHAWGERLSQREYSGLNRTIPTAWGEHLSDRQWNDLDRTIPTRVGRTQKRGAVPL